MSGMLLLQQLEQQSLRARVATQAAEYGWAGVAYSLAVCACSPPHAAALQQPHCASNRTTGTPALLLLPPLFFPPL